MSKERSARRSDNLSSDSQDGILLLWNSRSEVKWPNENVCVFGQVCVCKIREHKDRRTVAESMSAFRLDFSMVNNILACKQKKVKTITVYF